MAIEIQARRWLAVWYQCPACGAQSGNPMLTPTKVHREYAPECHDWRCKRTMVIVERRYYTTFAIEAGVSATTIAGTLEKIGPFKVCDIVHHDIRAFRKWVEQRRAELAEQHRLYQEEWQRREAEGEAQRKREAKERALLLEAEQVARAAWPESPVERDEPLNDLEDYPF